MLFNSYEFLLAYFPLTLIVCFIITRQFGRERAIVWLVLASLFYYGWWEPSYVGLILASIAVNFATGRRIGTLDHTAARTRRVLLAAGISFNLVLLGSFKYANFFADTAASLTGTESALMPLVLPLAISFFTFQQIAFLSDAYHRITSDYSFRHYALFVTFFPQLIAGPIVHHAEMMPQFRRKNALRPQMRNLALGGSIFAIGLFKKVVLADGVAPYASAAFAAAAGGARLTFFEAWGGALAYTFQIYFDFSGYSDMAIGSALMFGIRLPINFFSPYKATSIVEFWRRWHITLSRFLRDYLYIPLGGNRHGPGRRYANLMTTMILGGLWHGAGWTFVFWGALHGAYLVVNHGWRRICKHKGLNALAGTIAGRALAWLLTFVAVVIGWVFFRAESFAAAGTMLHAMAGLNGVSLPNALVSRLGPDIAAQLAGMGVRTHLGEGWTFVLNWLWVGTLLMLALIAPNTIQLTRAYRPTANSLDNDATADAVQPWRRAMLGLRWQPNWAWAAAVSVIAAMGFLGLSSVSEFLYFQF
jgi:D-alanyl-lipoteichoic acid acyltransferase DltB (MBOAT superfamily)